MVTRGPRLAGAACGERGGRDGRGGRGARHRSSSTALSLQRRARVVVTLDRNTHAHYDDVDDAAAEGECGVRCCRGSLVLTTTTRGSSAVGRDSKCLPQPFSFHLKVYKSWKVFQDFHRSHFFRESISKWD